MNKLDCIGHVQKRTGKKRLNIGKDKKLKDGKNVGGRSGRLTRAAIDKVRYYGNAIPRNVDGNAKTRNKGYVAVDTAAGSATLAFNSGAQGRHVVMEMLEIPPGVATKAGSVRKDKRVVQSVRHIEQKYQDVRAKISNAQAREQKKLEDAEWGPTYLAGGFNKEILHQQRKGKPLKALQGQKKPQKD